uniref:Uncharacterized protein n=1 Tax=Romanomermis culicivorax TaxID=13658 RepID=A0A915I8B0_ROMCU
MESAFGEHMIKCVILNDNGNNQCIMGTDLLAHPDIHAILNFKDNYIEIQDIATAAADHNLTDHEPATLDKSFPGHTAQQKLEFALNKMTEKTYVSAAQKAKALAMLRHNRDVFSLPGDKPTITSELTLSINTGSAKPVSRYNQTSQPPGNEKSIWQNMYYL